MERGGGREGSGAAVGRGEMWVAKFRKAEERVGGGGKRGGDGREAKLRGEAAAF